MAELRVLGPTARLETDRDIVHHDNFLALHGSFSILFHLLEAKRIFIWACIFEEFIVVDSARVWSLVFLFTFLVFEFESIIAGLLCSWLARAARCASLLFATECLWLTEALVAMRLHLLIVRNRGWWSVALPHRYYIINNDPRVIAALKYFVDVLRSNVRHMLERSPWFLIVQTPKEN